MTDFASSLSFPKLDTHPNFPSLPHPSQIDNSAVSLGHFKVGESVYLPIKMLAPYHESAVPTLGSSPPEEDPAVIAAEEAASATPSEGEEGMSGGPASEEGSLEAEAAELSPEQVRQVQAAEAAASEAAAAAASQAATASQVAASHLWKADEAQEYDSFSSILGDAFHFMDRPRVRRHLYRHARSYYHHHHPPPPTHHPSHSLQVPVHHDHKKAYFVALRRAWFIFDEAALARVKKALKEKDGLSDEEIEAKMYYDFKYFRQRVPRVVPPPRQLYTRVRAVYATFGYEKDAESKQPLFNATAWEKASNVLKEILAGYASDPPGVSFYHQRLDAHGRPAFDEHGLPLYDCSRGTNDTECVHKQIVTTFGTWCTGIEMSDALLAEFRHRYNQRCSERRRAGFPRLGHYDTWLVDKLQELVERNHGKPLYAEWSSTSDYADTPEKFGTVPIYSEELGEALAERTAALRAKDADAFAKLKQNLTPDQQYICAQSGTELPMLPVHGKAELNLFQKLALEQTQFDAEVMALEWCEHVDGATVFPKLPVYLRTHHEAWKKNQQVKDAVERKKADMAALETINAETEADLMVDDLADADDDQTDGAGASSSSSGGGSGGGGGGGALSVFHPPVVQETTQHPTGFMPYAGPAPSQPHLVGGVLMALTEPVANGGGAGGKRKGAGGRPTGTGNAKKRAAPTCKQCGYVCPECQGGTPRGTCNSA